MVAESKSIGQQISEHRAEVARLRCEAFVDYTPEVADIRLRPITLASYNRLVAFQSPFVLGGPIDFEAVFVFVWVHHPEFGEFAVKAKRRALRRLFRAMHPRLPNLNMFARFVGQFPGWHWIYRMSVPTAEERFADAVTEIRRLVSEAMDDFPLGSDDDQNRQPSPVSLQAQLLNTFRRELSLSYAETESLPLKRLVQLLRESVYHKTGGKGLSLITRTEAALVREHLAQRAAQLNPR